SSALSSFDACAHHPALHSFPTRRSSDLKAQPHHQSKPFHPHRIMTWRVHVLPRMRPGAGLESRVRRDRGELTGQPAPATDVLERSEEHTSELQSLRHLVCRLLLEKKKYG